MMLGNGCSEFYWKLEWSGWRPPARDTLLLPRKESNGLWRAISRTTLTFRSDTESRSAFNMDAWIAALVPFITLLNSRNLWTQPSMPSELPLFTVEAMSSSWTLTPHTQLVLTSNQKCQKRWALQQTLLNPTKVQQVLASLIPLSKTGCEDASPNVMILPQHWCVQRIQLTDAGAGQNHDSSETVTKHKQDWGMPVDLNR